MQQQWYQDTAVNSLGQNLHFYMETIEVSRLTGLAFYTAGEKRYKGERFYWQNREKTMTLVGLGHAYTIQSETSQHRFDEVEAKWRSLTKNGDIQQEQPPILFGGFTFDPQHQIAGEWTGFPDAFFALATFQLVIQQDKAYVNLHTVTTEPQTEEQLQVLRQERDTLIQLAQETMITMYAKPEIIHYFEPHKEAYLASIDQVTALIKEKQADKVVIARSLALQFQEPVSTSQVLAQITEEQPESYLFGLEHQQLLFFGASPERLVKVQDRHAFSSCVAGSIKRGKTVAEDEVYGQRLLNDAKNGGEHQYVVDMIAQTFQENCLDVTLPSSPTLLKIRDIQHLYTPVEGLLKEGATILQLAKSLHPTPALGGSPRQAALEAIRQYEPMNRGLYAAPIGWVDAQGNGEFAVAIRSATLLQDKAYLYAGGGIVADSEAQAEYEETLVKFRPMLRALGGQLHD
ncbi:isochorismate synthase [Lysinibacillus piscis]|uniref:isochorismate synthase n=1 Tax=Lysinibacillus piscis TaxID=2518931 RepID=A0ABQ5NJC4_9BACI|nr:isochorismate synthase [Lysinibacillus sp. KH24]GLC88129.1 isochorismate synthase MenF [Lysinibacillus sp. KH24]